MTLAKTPPIAPRFDAVDTPEAARRRAELLVELAREVRSARVLDALARVPRHAFVADAPLSEAYANYPVPIGWGQTISQPAVVASMSEALELDGSERVLEIGTGSGYQAAILALLAREVFSIEVVPELALEARGRLLALGLANVHVRAGDGYAGWPEAAPFDRVLLTAAPDALPSVLADQLAEGGVLVAPVGPIDAIQRLYRYRKRAGKLAREDLGGVRFVPMVPGRS